jgi:hypothetical protein
MPPQLVVTCHSCRPSDGRIAVTVMWAKTTIRSRPPGSTSSAAIHGGAAIVRRSLPVAGSITWIPDSGR